MSEKNSTAANIRKYLVFLEAEGRAESTVADCRRKLGYFRQYLRARSAEDDTRKVDRKLLVEYRKHVLSKEEWSFNNRLEVLHTVLNFFHHLANQGILLMNPAAAIKLPRMSRNRLPGYLTAAEVEELLEKTDPNTPEGLRDRAVLETLYSTGMRSGEAAALEVNNINFQEGHITIHQGKGKKDRVVPIGKTALHYIDRYMREVRGPGKNPALFRSLWKGEELCGEALRAIVRRACKRAGITKRVYPHLLRHSFAVHLLENGASISHIAAMLGHEHLATTQIYTLVLPVQLKKAYEAAHPGACSKEKLPKEIKPKELYKKPSSFSGR